MANNKIERGQAREFYRDLCGAVNGDANRTCCGIMSADLIADHLRIDTETAERYLRACAEYGITERQGGGWVV